jgi:hypothetical protein
MIRWPQTQKKRKLGIEYDFGDLEELMANGHGGKRLKADGTTTGGSRPGHRWLATMEKALVREETRKFIQQHMPAMLRAQIAHAIGIGHVFTRDKHGKFSRIEDEAQIDRLLSEGVKDTDYWIFAKDPSVQAFSVLIDRTLDQAPRAIELTGKDGGPIELVSRIAAARKRLSEGQTPR